MAILKQVHQRQPVGYNYNVENTIRNVANRFGTVGMRPVPRGTGGGENPFVMKLLNSSSSVIPAGEPCCKNTAMSIRPLSMATDWDDTLGITAAFVGISLEDIQPHTIGRVQVCGYLPFDYAYKHLDDSALYHTGYDTPIGYRVGRTYFDGNEYPYFKCSFVDVDGQRVVDSISGGYVLIDGKSVFLRGWSRAEHENVRVRPPFMVYVMVTFAPTETYPYTILSYKLVIGNMSQQYTKCYSLCLVESYSAIWYFDPQIFTRDIYDKALVDLYHSYYKSNIPSRIEAFTARYELGKVKVKGGTVMMKRQLSPYDVINYKIQDVEFDPPTSTSTTNHYDIGIVQEYNDYPVIVRNPSGTNTVILARVTYYGSAVVGPYMEEGVYVGNALHVEQRIWQAPLNA